MRLPSPPSLTYTSLQHLPALCLDQLSLSDRQIELWRRSLEGSQTIEGVLGRAWWAFLALALLGRGSWWLVVLQGWLYLAWSLRRTDDRATLLSWERARQTQSWLPELVAPLRVLGLEDLRLQVDPSTPALVFESSQGCLTTRRYRSDWVTVHGTRAGLVVEITLRDELETEVYCSEHCHETQSTPSSTVCINLTSPVAPDRRLTRLRRRFPDSQLRGGALSLTCRREGRARLEHLLAVLSELDLPGEVVLDPCPGCGQPLAERTCLSCEACWRTQPEGARAAAGPIPFGHRLCPGCDAELEVIRVGRDWLETCQHCLGFWVSRNFQSRPVGSGHECAGYRLASDERCADGP